MYEHVEFTWNKCQQFIVIMVVVDFIFVQGSYLFVYTEILIVTHVTINHLIM